MKKRIKIYDSAFYSITEFYLFQNFFTLKTGTEVKRFLLKINSQKTNENIKEVNAVMQSRVPGFYITEQKIESKNKIQ